MATERYSDNRPDRPTMVWDGDCGFCAKWVARVRRLTGDKVAYGQSQIRGKNFPEVSEEEYGEAVHLIDTDGGIYRGAAAVCRTLLMVWWLAWLWPLYERVPLFAKVTEWAYERVARNRMLFSRITRWLWGKSVAPSTYVFSSWLVPRLVGAIGLVSVVSLMYQADGLIGHNGILPMEQYFSAVETALKRSDPETNPFWKLPAVFWWWRSDVALGVVFSVATVAAMAMMLGRLVPVAAVVFWVAYLSIAAAGQVFLGFQWDSLLLQTAFIMIFYGAWRWRDELKTHANPNFLARWMVWLTVLLLMLESGVVKLQSYGVAGENTWRDLTALNYHYWTQPIPNALAWFAHQMPEWFGAWSVRGLLWLETWLLVLLIMPRRIRHVGALLQIGLQLAIIATGNYGFFNYLTIALCLTFFDDRFWPQCIRRRFEPEQCVEDDSPKVCEYALEQEWRPAQEKRSARITKWALVVPVFCVFCAVGAFQLAYSFEENRAGVLRESAAGEWLKANQWFSNFYSALTPFRTLNSYGLFRVMTTARPEIRVLGSMDGKEWREYTFYYKPTDTRRAPPQIIPGYMPRLDWQLWFAALQFDGGRIPAWVPGFLERLAQGEPSVLRLIESNPFTIGKPRYFRLELYHYEFTTAEERKATGDWWKAGERVRVWNYEARSR